MDYKGRPFVMMKDYYKQLDKKAKEEAEEHKKKRDKPSSSGNSPTVSDE